MCDKAHHYTVEVAGQAIRYAGTSAGDALDALCGISEDEEGYVVAEHAEPVSYCPAESNRLENAAMKAADEFAQSWQDAVDAFHGEGPYALANQDI
jgi:hypothetical protein